jgi:hypothetical protein
VLKYVDKNLEITPALLVIDVQKMALPSRTLWEFSKYIQGISSVCHLIDICRKSEIPIFFIHTIRESSGMEFLASSTKFCQGSEKDSEEYHMH